MICLPLAAAAGNLSPHFPLEYDSRQEAPCERRDTRNFYVGVTIAALIAVLAIAQYTLQTVASAQENGNGNRAGVYEVDRMWPKPLPNNWVLGSTVGLAIDARDHVFIVHRGQSSLDQKFASQMAFTPPAPRGGGARARRRRPLAALLRPVPAIPLPGTDRAT